MIKMGIHPHYLTIAASLTLILGNVNAFFFPLSGACFLDDVNIQPESTYQISHCSYCQCISDINTNVSCYKKSYTGDVQKLCENCTSLPSDGSCSYCEKPGNQSVLIPSGNSIDIKEGTECISCNCSREGEISCYYFDNYTLCNIPNLCENFLKNPKDVTFCTSGCIDPSTSLLRPEGKWITQEGIACSCMASMVSCVQLVPLGLFLFNAGCLPGECNPEKYRELFIDGKDCKFNGQTIQHNTTSYAQVYDVKGCFQCSCYAGQLKCQIFGSYEEGTFPDITHRFVFIRCSSIEECEKEKLSNTNGVKKYCDSSPLKRSCKGIYKWTTDMCHLNCNQTGELPRYEVIGKSWCSALPELQKDDCDSSCPDREQYLKDFGQALVSCNSTEQYIWKDQICDGKSECLNNEDEENCKTYYCPYSYDANQVLWPSIEVGKTREILCNQVPVLVTNFTQYGLKGKMSRTCIKESHFTNITIWENTLSCQCTINELEMSNNANNNPTYTSINKDIQRLYEHLNISPSSIQHYKLITKFLNITLNKLRYDNSSEGNFTFQTSEWHDINDPILYNMMKTIAKMEKTKRFCQEKNQEMDVLFFHLVEHFNLPQFNYGDKPTTSLVKALGAENKLMQKMEKESQTSSKTKLDTLEEILSAISIICLVLGLVAFRLVRKKSLKLFIHQNLMLSVLLNAICYKIPLWFVTNLPYTSEEGCFAVSILSYLFTLSTFSWMMVEGINIIIIVVFVFKGNQNYYKQYLCIGYGMPVVLTGIFVGIFHLQFSKAYQCTVLEGDYLWVLRGPVSLYILVNTIFFISIMIKIRRLTIEGRSIRAKSSQGKKNNPSTKTFLVLVPLLGIPFILAPFVEYSIYIAYTFVIVNGLTGVYLLIGHVILDTMVVEEIKKSQTFQRIRSTISSSCDKQ